MKTGIEVFIPGRLCLFGEHSDWAADYRKVNSNLSVGKAIIYGLEYGISSIAQKSDNLIFSSNTFARKHEISLPLIEEYLVQKAKNRSFFSYAIASAYIMFKRYPVKGINLNAYKTTLPIKIGLGSSAAICVSVIRSYNLLYDLNLSVSDEMEIAYDAEHFALSQCGHMDQLCALGKKLICVEFDETTKYKEIKLPKDVYIIIVDLNGKRNTRKILNSLNAAYPFPKNENDLKLYQALGVKNIEIINDATASLERGNLNLLGALMKKAQIMFDADVAPFCEDLRSPKLHELINDSVVSEISLGVKGLGAQGDGAAQIVVIDRNDQENLSSYIIDKYGYSVYPIQVKANV